MAKFGRLQRKALVVAALGALSLGLSSCVVTAPSTKGFSEACAPAGIPVDHIDVKFLSAPAGSTLKGEVAWYYNGTPPDGLPGVGVYDVTVSNPVAGETRTLFTKSPGSSPTQLNVPRPGQCVHLTSTGGLSYEVTIYPDTDAGTILGWALGILPLPNTFVWGYPQGSLPPPTPPPDSNVPVDVNGVTDAVNISASFLHTCAALATGAVKCWGLGYSSFTNYDPVTIAGISGATSVGTGWYHNCAIVAGGAVDCWGDNAKGQLGNGTNTPSAVPVEVTGITGATSIAAGFYRTCAVVGGAVKCWGDSSLTPTDVPGITDAVKVEGDAGTFCAVVTGGAVKCWGENQGGQFGNGTWGSGSGSATPVDVPGITGTADLSVGHWHTCDAHTDGTLQCWGRNDAGQLGIGTTTAVYTPTNVGGLPAVTRVGVGEIHTCAVTVDTAVHCWGTNSDGELGNGTFSDSYVPSTVSGLTGAVDVVAASDYSCALMSGGGVKCWGENGSGELGRDTHPPAVVGLVRVTIAG
ncbi:MAG: hypothetical protein U0Q22_15055 [Acidimicrobiales bacterium]